MTHRDINRAGLELIKDFESFVPFVYDDQKPYKSKYGYREWDGSKPRGVLTVGYGHTNSAKHPLKITQGLRVTEPEALEILDVDLDECEDDVSRLVTVPLTDNQFSALVSFQFNTGNLAKASFRRELNKGNYDAVRSGLMQYVKATNRATGKLETLRGLVRRRQAEVTLFYRKDSNTAVRLPKPIVDPTELKGTVVPTPPPEDESLSKSGVMKGAATAAVGSTGLVADKTSEIVDTMSQADTHISAGTWFGLAIGLVILGGSLYAMYSRAKASNSLPSWFPQFLK